MCGYKWERFQLVLLSPSLNRLLMESNEEHFCGRCALPATAFYPETLKTDPSETSAGTSLSLLGTCCRNLNRLLTKFASSTSLHPSK